MLASLSHDHSSETKEVLMIRRLTIFCAAAALVVGSAFGQTYENKSKSETKVKGTEVKTKTETQTKAPGTETKSKSETVTRNGVVVKSKTKTSEKTKTVQAKPVKTKPVKVKPVKTKAVVRVEHDVNQLEPLLAGVNTTATINSTTWMRLANEANMLANRIYANTRSARASCDVVSAARELRTHVELFRSQVRAGDLAGARAHAQEALTIAYRIDQWAS